MAENIYLFRPVAWKALSWVLNVKCGLCVPYMEPTFSESVCACVYTQRQTPIGLRVTASARGVKKSFLGDASYNWGTSWLHMYSNLIFQTWQHEMYTSGWDCCGISLGAQPVKSCQCTERHLPKRIRIEKTEWFETALLSKLVFCFLLDISVIIIDVN